MLPLQPLENTPRSALRDFQTAPQSFVQPPDGAGQSVQKT